MPALLLTREPVLDRQQLLAGYRLEFRTDGAGVPDATAPSLHEHYHALGLGAALAGSSVFLRIDADLLRRSDAGDLPDAAVILELPLAGFDDPSVLAAASALKANGRRFCLAGLTDAAALDHPAIPLADYLKFDLAAVAPEHLQTLAGALRAARRPVIAAGIASHEQFDLCALLGVELFEGYFFAQARPSAGRPLDAGVQAIFRLIGQLGGEAEIDELEATLRSEPALIVNLLRLTNSVGVGARTRIISVRHAIAILGRRQLMRWLQLLLFQRDGQAEPGRNPLMQYAALRGRFMELMTARLGPGMERLGDAAFLCGLLSVLPAALDLPLRDILTQMPVEDRVRLALLHHDGQLGQLLALLDAYDGADIAAVQAQLAAYPGSDPALLGQLLAESLGWVQSLQREA